MTRTKTLLLAAGEGTRLRPLTHVLPKCLVPLGGRPLLAHWVQALQAAGVTETVINTHAHAPLVRDFVAASNRHHATRLIESHEPTLLGSAGTITANPHLADEADVVLIAYADNLSRIDLATLLAFHASHPDPFTMLLFHASNPGECGIATLDASDRVVAFEEKPTRPVSNLANAGLYVVDAAVYREMATTRAFDIGHDLLPRFVGRMRGYRFNGFHLDIGSPEAYLRAQREAGTWSTDGDARRPAVFFDRDGTLIEDVPYLTDPAQVRLMPDAATTLKRCRHAGFACVVTTNQSAVGRGMLSETALAEVHRVFLRALQIEGADLDAIYHCPMKPTVSDRDRIEDLARKPGPGMLWEAADALRLDVRRSWMVGDMVSDALAGRYAGCRGSIWLRRRGTNVPDETLIDHHIYDAADLTEATDLMLAMHTANPCGSASDAPRDQTDFDGSSV